MLDSLKRDTRLAIRSLLRSPGFTIPAALTLAIGIGGTALILTTADAAFSRDLAFGNADRLVHLWQVSPRSNQASIPLQVARDWQAEARSFDCYALVLGTGPTTWSTSLLVRPAIAPASVVDGLRAGSATAHRCARDASRRSRDNRGRVDGASTCAIARRARVRDQPARSVDICGRRGRAARHRVRRHLAPGRARDAD